MSANVDCYGNCVISQNLAAAFTSSLVQDHLEGLGFAELRIHETLKKIQSLSGKFQSNQSA